MYKALASASPFLTAEGDETRSKKCHILMSAVVHMFSMNSLWMQYFTKNWAYDRFVENAAPSKILPNFFISLQTKAACYYPLF